MAAEAEDEIGGRGTMRWALPRKAAISDKWLYLGTASLLLGGTALYVYRDMHENDWRNARPLVFNFPHDGFDEFTCREMYLGSEEKDDGPRWSVGASTNPARPQFLIVITAPIPAPSARAVDPLALKAVVVDGVRLGVRRWNDPPPPRHGSVAIARYGGCRSDLAAMAAGREVVFDFGERRYRMAESDRAILNALLRSFDQATASMEK